VVVVEVVSVIDEVVGSVLVGADGFVVVSALLVLLLLLLLLLLPWSVVPIGSSLQAARLRVSVNAARVNL